MINYNLIRSKRKTIAIRITQNAEVEVRAPLRAPKKEIDSFILSKQDWINSNLISMKIQLEKKAEFNLNYGDMLSLQGKNYPITKTETNHMGFDGNSFYLPTMLSSEEIKQAIIQIYKMVAKKILMNKVSYYANIMKVNPTAVKVNSAKTRWGSCSGKNSINFSWYLIMADEKIIDYVVVHELSHIREHNHSNRFWKIVESVLPDYKEREAKLKEFQKQLEGENWE